MPVIQAVPLIVLKPFLAHDSTRFVYYVSCRGMIEIKGVIFPLSNPTKVTTVNLRPQLPSPRGRAIGYDNSLIISKSYNLSVVRHNWPETSGVSNSDVDLHHNSPSTSLIFMDQPSGKIVLLRETDARFCFTIECHSI